MAIFCHFATFFGACICRHNCKNNENNKSREQHTQIQQITEREHGTACRHRRLIAPEAGALLVKILGKDIAKNPVVRAMISIKFHKG